MKKLFTEFKEFAFKGNMIDLAVGMIIGSAFTGVVNALVTLILGIMSGIFAIPENLAEASIQIGELSIPYGGFLTALINFILIAICIFILVKSINTAKAKLEKDKAEEVPAEPEKSAEVLLLEEIRDLLKK